MANENIRLTSLIMNDGFPGSPNPNLGIPAGGFDATAWNFSTTDNTALAENPPYPPGTKIQAYTDNSNCQGYYTMAYLARHEYSTECISSDISETGIFCAGIGEECVTHWSVTYTDNSHAPWWVVAKIQVQGDSTKITCASLGLPIAIACSTVDADSSEAAEMSAADPKELGYGHAWGWFWVGGVCPCADITFLKGLGNSLLGVDITVDSGESGYVFACATGAAGNGVFMPTNDLSSANDLSMVAGAKCLRPFAWVCNSGV